MTTNTETNERPASVRQYAERCIKEEAQAVMQLLPQLDESFDRAVSLMYHCRGKVIVTGDPLDVFHGDLGVMTRDDVVLAISYSGQTDELLRFIPMVLHMNIPIIGMSGNDMSLLAKYSTVHLHVKVDREACPLNLAPTSSTTATLVMGDALAVALMQVRDFKPRDFAQFHPGGELGKRLLTTAQDVMRTDELPVIPPTMHLGEAIIHVSKGKLGLAVAVTDGRVAGIITDGDIRRAMEKWQAEFFNRTVADIMTRQPKTALPSAKISDIQKMMNTYKIHSILIVSEDKRHVIILFLNRHAGSGLPAKSRRQRAVPV